MQLSLQAKSVKQSEDLLQEFLQFMSEMGAEPNAFHVTPFDVVCFLMEKDNAGKTIVHERNCKFVRCKTRVSEQVCECARRLKWNTIDSYIGRLRGRFRDLGLTTPWCYRTSTGNPCDSAEVKLYLKLIGKEQLHAGVYQPKQAALFNLSLFRKLIDVVLEEWIEHRNKAVWLEAARCARDALLYSLMWHTGLRASDALQLLQQNIMPFSPTGQIPGGWYMYTAGSKTEFRPNQSRVFRLVNDGSRYAPMRIWAIYVEAIGNMGLAVRPGDLFRDLKEDAKGVVTWCDVAVTRDAMATRFRKYADAIRVPDTVRLHSFHGSHAAYQEATGVPQEQTCQEMSWNQATYSYYVHGRPVLSIEDIKRFTGAPKGEL